MNTQTTAAWIFTIGSFATWAIALRWAMSRPRDRWYHVWVLGLMTLFWWLGESMAIRLGKYHYPALPFRLHLPFGGSPSAPSAFSNWLLTLLPNGELPPWKTFPACAAESWDIPLPVVAIEAALLFGIFHLTRRLLKYDKGVRIRGALATAGLAGLLMVNVTAVLDPVVSTTVWCHSSPDPGYHSLNVRLWEWYTTPAFPGFWFGVPLVNYAAWFLAAAAFALVARVDDQRNTLIIRRYRVIALYLVATVLITAITLGLLIVVKIFADRIFAYGRTVLFDASRVPQREWEFGVLLTILALGGVAFGFGRRHQNPTFEAISSIPMIAVLLFCLLLLLWQPHLGILVVWLVASAIAATVLVWPAFARSLARGRTRKEFG